VDGCQLGIEIPPAVAASVRVEDDVIPLKQLKDGERVNLAAAEVVALRLREQAG